MPPEFIDKLRELSGAFEMYEVVGTYKGYRECKDAGGGIKQITIEVWDMGLGDPSIRYRVHVVDEDGRGASGNAMGSVAEAAALVHWWELDGAPRP